MRKVSCKTLFFVISLLFASFNSFTYSSQLINTQQKISSSPLKDDEIGGTLLSVLHPGKMDQSLFLKKIPRKIQFNPFKVKNKILSVLRASRNETGEKKDKDMGKSEISKISSISKL